MDNLVKLNEREVKLANIFWPGIGDGDFTPEGYALLKKYEKKVLEWCKESEHVKKSQEILHDSETSKENGDSLTCPESEELETEIEWYFTNVFCGETQMDEIARYFANWQQEQFEKNRLAACDAQTKEEAEREWNFVEKMISVEHRQPTYSDAINYGMKVMKEQMMKDAIDATKVFSGIGSNSKTGECVPYTEYKICISDKLCDGLDKVKLIIIKEKSF